MADKVEDILMTPKQVAKRWWPEDKESVAITKFYKWRESIRAKGVEFPMVKLNSNTARYKEKTILDFEMKNTVYS